MGYLKAYIKISILLNKLQPTGINQKQFILTSILL